MSHVNITEVVNNFSALITRSRSEAVFIKRFGHAEAVIISPEQYERLMTAFEELEDLRAFDDAMAEPGDNIPLDRS